MKKRFATKDFTITDMPHNRIEVFKDILFNKTSKLFSLGLILLLFSLPLIIVTILSNASIAKLDPNTGSYWDDLYLIINTQNILLLISLLILAIGCSGIYKVVKYLIWQEGFLFWHEFKEGIKENCKEFLYTFGLIGILNFALQFIFYNPEIEKYIFVIAIIICAIFLPTVIFTLSQSNMYNLPFIFKMKNSFLIAWRHWYTSILVLLLNVGFVILPIFIKSGITYLLLLLLIPLIIGPLLILFNNLYVNVYLDRYINKDHFPEIYDKGIIRNEQN